MLKSLKIKNIGLITECEIEFDKGLNVLSGETGAGKSVILDSINFVLGQKADKSMILSGQTECSVVCVFDISDCELAKAALDELEIESDGEIIIKRTFGENSKGSIKLNGESVTASMLKTVTSHLVDVHGQSDHFALLKTSCQLDLIDKIGASEVSEAKRQIAAVIDEIKSYQEKLKAFGGSDEQRIQRLDYLRFAIDEINSFALYENEEEELNERRKKMQNIEKIIGALGSAHAAISEENGALDLAISANRSVSSLFDFGNEYQEISEKIDNAITLLQDAASQISDLSDEEYDSEQADAIERRIEGISKLKLKYGNGYEKIMASLQAFLEEYDLISKSSQLIGEYNAKIDELRKQLSGKYAILTNARKNVVKSLSKDIENKLKELAMPKAVFTVEFKTCEGEQLSYNGIDEIVFMFSANGGFEPRPLSKVISGGELSRFMLAVKSTTASTVDAHTYIFDEIDAGISGNTASVVAENFASIAKDKQIIAISHLPQIVAVSDLSMFIKKTEIDGKTRTEVQALTDENKVSEVLRLVGGDETSEVAVLHAKQMIEKFDRFKKGIK